MFTWILVFLMCSWKIETLFLKWKYQKLQIMQLKIKLLFFLLEYMNESFANTYQCLSELVCPTIPVKYPRTPGHRPVPDENIHNAW